jgi:nucleoside phosphorylase
VRNVLPLSVDAAFAFKLSGKPFRPQGDLTKHAEHMEFANSASFTTFGDQCEKTYLSLLEQRVRDELESQKLIRRCPEVVGGKVASGPIVAGSSRFTAWLKSRDRKYLVVEMESAGVLAACEPFDVTTMVIRGVSDFGDDRKKQLCMID